MKENLANALGAKPSIVVNPFVPTCVDSIMLRCSKSWLNGEYRTYAKIEFKNGNTDGCQTIQADNLQEALIKTYEFLESLK